MTEVGCVFCGDKFDFPDGGGKIDIRFWKMYDFTEKFRESVCDSCLEKLKKIEWRSLIKRGFR